MAKSMMSSQVDTPKSGTVIKALTKRLDFTFLLPAAIFIAAFMIYPVIYNFIISFKDITLSNLIKGEQHFIGLDNYVKVLKDPALLKAFINSLYFTVGCLSFQFVFGFLFALFYNIAFPGHRWMRAITLVAWMTPIVITGTIFKWMMSGDYGILNYILIHLGIVREPLNWLSDSNTALLSVIIANIWIGIPFNMIILLAGLQGLPGSLYEAAKIDGASRIQQFWSITLPLLKPTILILFMLGIIYSFKAFDIVYILTGGGPANTSTILPYYAYELSFSVYHFGEGAAVSNLMLVLIGIVALFYLYLVRKEDVMS